MPVWRVCPGLHVLITILKRLLFSFTTWTQEDEAELEKILQELIKQNEELDVCIKPFFVIKNEAFIVIKHTCMLFTHP